MVKGIKKRLVGWLPFLAAQIFEPRSGRVRDKRGEGRGGARLFYPQMAKGLQGDGSCVLFCPNKRTRSPSTPFTVWDFPTLLAVDVDHYLPNTTKNSRKERLSQQR